MNFQAAFCADGRDASKDARGARRGVLFADANRLRSREACAEALQEREAIFGFAAAALVASRLSRFRATDGSSA
jgi:hypothetical protein